MIKKLRSDRRHFIKISGLVLFFLLIPVAILGGIILVNRNTAYKNATLVAEKETYKSNELPKFKLYLNEEEKDSLSFLQAFAQEEPKVEAKIIDSEKNTTELQTDVRKLSNGEYDISVKPTLQYKPGKNTLSVKIYSLAGERTITQDFSWGVLAINTNKSTYQPGEEAKVMIGVLDERGLMVCGAEVKLEITGPEGFKKVLTSENGDIKVHEVCKSFDYTLTPDFSTAFTIPEAEGEYKMKLKATTFKGEYGIEDVINVKNDIPFEIERISATRTYPLNDYPMQITIKVNQDFKGKLIETVPQSFDIRESHQEGRKTDYAAFTSKREIDKTITYDVDLKKGETYKFDYIFDAPNVSPEFFLMGNLQFVNNSLETVYTEGRYWQIANDATHLLTSGTSWSVPIDFNTTNTIYLLGGGAGGGGAANSGGGTAAGGGGGGGGGEMRVLTNFNPGVQSSITYSIGSGGGGGGTASNGTGGGDTTWDSGTYLANGGVEGASGAGTGIGNAGGSGGTGGVGYNGAAGGNGAALSGNNGGGGGGGGGAGGTTAAASTPASNGSGTTGGNGTAGGNTSGGSLGSSGSNGNTGNPGGNGTAWGGTDGAGGGGGGGGAGIDGADEVGRDGGDGGNYGGGGGGGGGGARGNNTDGSGGDGIQGAIFISYTPLTVNINVSGNVYNAGTASTPLSECDGSGATFELHLRAKGNTYNASCSNSDGSFTFSNVNMIGASAGEGMVIWIDRSVASGATGAMVIRWVGSATNSTSNTFYDDTITLTSDNTNAVTNTTMDVYDADGGNVDIPYVVTGNYLIASAGAELQIKEKSGVSGSGNYDPGGTVITGAGGLHLDDNSIASLDTSGSYIGGDLVIDNGATLTISANTTLGGDVSVTGTLASSGTPTVYTEGTGTISGAGNKTIYDLNIGAETSSVYAANFDLDTVEVINTRNDTLTSTVSVGNGPYAINILPDGSKVYVANIASLTDTVSVINTSTNTVIASPTVGTGPESIAITPDGSKVYVANSNTNTVSVINSSTDTVSTTITAGTQAVDIKMTPDGSKTYSANFGPDTVSVINTSTDTVIATPNVGSNPYRIAITPNGSKAYVINNGTNTVSVINTSTDTVSTTITVGSTPYDIKITPDGSKAYVANQGPDTVSVINTSTDTVIATPNVGADPNLIAISPDGSKAYVVNQSGNTVSVINTSTDTVSTTITAGFQPEAIEITPDGSKVYLANTFASVQVIYTNTDTVSYIPLTNSSRGLVIQPAVATVATTTLTGTLSVSNNLTVDTGSTLNGTGDLNVGSSSVSNSGGISVAGTINMTGGTVTAVSSSGGTATIGGAGSMTFYNLSIAPAVASGPTFTFGSAASQTINVSNDLTIGNGSNGVTVTANTNNPAINVDGDFTVAASGTFTAPPTSNFNVGINFTNNGTFNANGGEVILDTINAAIIDGNGTPAITFSDLTSTTQNKSISFTQGETYQINGMFTITGAVNNLINIGSTTSTQWLIDLDGSASVTYANISNSGCAVSTSNITLGATNHNSGNNNTCWDFGVGGGVTSGETLIRGGVNIRGGTSIINN